MRARALMLLSIARRVTSASRRITLVGKPFVERNLIRCLPNVFQSVSNSMASLRAVFSSASVWTADTISRGIFPSGAPLKSR
jgi:hypothetical protein